MSSLTDILRTPKTPSVPLSPPPATPVNAYALSQAPRTQNDNVITWNGRFCSVNPNLFQSYEKTRFLGKLLLVLSAASALGALAAASILQAKPVVILYTVAGCSASSLILVATAIYCLTKHCWNDGAYRGMQGAKVEAELREKMRA